MSHRIVCFGEILWDSLPAGLFPGGAPLNVAFHLRQLGLRPLMLSTVGADFLGDELLRRMKSWGLDCDGVTRSMNEASCVVQAVLDHSGAASYRIPDKTAWDEIALTQSVTDALRDAFGLVFGSLALRSPTNRKTLKAILKQLPNGVLRIFDVNLRAPYDDLDLVAEMAAQTSLLKVNDEEARRLTDPRTDLETAARELAQRWSIPSVCITCGPRGAGFLHENTWHFEPNQPIEVVDTVGAGDAFLAALTAALAEGKSAPEALRLATRRGEAVAASHGPTPLLP